MRLPVQDLQGNDDPFVKSRKNPFWVTIVRTELEEDVDINDLSGGVGGLATRRRRRA